MCRRSTLCLLLVLAACRRPAPTPLTWEGRVAQATRLDPALAQLPPADQTSYTGGFSHGAGMIHNALLEERVPYLPRPDFNATPERPRGPVPKEFDLPAPVPVPQVEVDAVTGLPLAPVMGGGDITWTRGVLAGFRWALELERETFLRRGQLRAVGPLPLPAPGAWQPWPTLRPDLFLHGDRQDTLQAWRVDLLAWRSDERGFPPRRSWRAMIPSFQFHHIALADRALWLDTFEGHAVALDRATGLVLAVLPGVHRVPTPAPGGAAWIASWRAAVASRRAASRVQGNALAQAADRGDSLALHALGHQVLAASPAQGVDLIRRAALKGCPDAQIDVALACLEGAWGFTADPGQAWIWLAFAQRGGNRDAAEGMAALYPPASLELAPARGPE